MPHSRPMPRCALDLLAPTGDTVLEYDRQHLLIYAELIDAADAGIDWRAGALDILHIDPASDAERARCCWESHLVRARWIVGDGLGKAIEAFGSLPRNVDRTPLN